MRIKKTKTPNKTNGLAGPGESNTTSHSLIPFNLKQVGFVGRPLMFAASGKQASGKPSTTLRNISDRSSFIISTLMIARNPPGHILRQSCGTVKSENFLTAIQGAEQDSSYWADEAMYLSRYVKTLRVGLLAQRHSAAKPQPKRRNRK